MDSLRSLLESPELLFAVTLTAKTCAAAGAGFILFAPLLALLFSRRSAFWVRALSFVVTLPLVFPPVALGYLLLLLFGRGGFLGGILDEAGLSIVFSENAVFLAAFIAGLPLVVRPIEAALSGERLKSLEFAACVHGANAVTVFRVLRKLAGNLY